MIYVAVMSLSGKKSFINPAHIVRIDERDGNEDCELHLVNDGRMMVDEPAEALAGRVEDLIITAGIELAQRIHKDAVKLADSIDA